jgi:DNA-binding transcriptional LysR family regulator
MPRPVDPRIAPLRLTLRQLQIFVAVAAAGSTIAAARQVSLSQSATSAALNELEALLGGQLFSRAGRRLVLNEQGRTMLPEARRLLDAAQGLEAQFGAAGDSQAPHLRLAASTTTGNYVVPKVIASYRRKVGSARFTVEIGNTRQVALAVANFEVDLGFIEGPTNEGRLTAIPWVTDELVIVCAPRHALASGRKGRKVPLGELREATWLLREPGSGTREVVERALLPRLHHLHTDADLGSAEAIKQAAAEGLGVTCLSRHAVADLLALGRLVELATALPAIRRTFHIIHPERRYLSPTLRRFLEHCRAYRSGR